MMWLLSGGIPLLLIIAGILLHPTGRMAVAAIVLGLGIPLSLIGLAWAVAHGSDQVFGTHFTEQR